MPVVGLAPRLVHGAHLLYTPRPMHGATLFSSRWIREKIFFFGRLLFFLALTAATFPLSAKNGQFSTEPEYFEFDESLVEKWKESEVTLPPYPKDQDLLPVTLPVTDTLKIYIDRASLSRGVDRVARFTLVVESPSGARSIFFDGIRCETGEYKTYALGTLDQAFTPAKNAQWQRITQPAINAFRFHLYRNLICDTHSSARPPKELVRLLTQ